MTRRAVGELVSLAKTAAPESPLVLAVCACALAVLVVADELGEIAKALDRERGGS